MARLGRTQPFPPLIQGPRIQDIDPQFMGLTPAREDLVPREPPGPNLAGMTPAAHEE